MTKEKAERIARQLTAGDDDGWSYRAAAATPGLFCISVYNEDNEFMGILS